MCCRMSNKVSYMRNEIIIQLLIIVICSKNELICYVGYITIHLRSLIFSSQSKCISFLLILLNRPLVCQKPFGCR